MSYKETVPLNTTATAEPIHLISSACTPAKSKLEIVSEGVSPIPFHTALPLVPPHELGKLRTLQIGWPLGMPLVRSLGEGLWEVRSNIPNGIARIIFKMIHGEIVLLHGFIKKTQKTPQDELEIAKKRARKYVSK